MEREIKFKFWLGHTKKMTCEHTLIEIAHLHWDFTEDIIPLQYTGLKDKSGKDIYEGDICSTYNINEPSNLVDTVVFDDGSFVFQNDYKLSAELRGFKSDYIEIIGNIYENPELLNK